jgi:hypothetical protein
VVYKEDAKKNTAVEAVFRILSRASYWQLPELLDAPAAPWPKPAAGASELRDAEHSDGALLKESQTVLSKLAESRLEVACLPFMTNVGDPETPYVVLSVSKIGNEG